MFQFIKENKLFSAFFVLTLLALPVPLFTQEILPFQDLPQHISTVSVIHNIDNPEYDFKKYYHLDYSSTQYLLYYLMCDLLSYALPVETAAKIVIAFYTAAYMLAFLLFLRTFGRNVWAVFFAVPFVYDRFLFMGFINYNLAIPLLLAGLAIAAQNAREFSVGKWLALCLTAILIFFSHAIIYLVFGFAACLYLMVNPRKFKQIALSLSAVIPSVAPFIIWMMRSLILSPQEVWEKGNLGRNLSPAKAEWESISVKFSEFSNRVFPNYPDNSDKWLLLFFVALFILILALSARYKKRESGAGEEFTLYPELLSLSLFLIYFLAPTSYKWVWPINWRFAPLTCVLFIAWIEPLWPRGMNLFFLPVIAAGFFSIYNNATHFTNFDRETVDFKEILQKMERGKRVMGLVFNKGSAYSSDPVYIHFPQYYQAEKGGVVNFSFANFAQSPVKFNASGAPPILPLRWEWTPEKFRFKEHGQYYDYFLIRDNGEKKASDIFRESEDMVNLVARRGNWALFEKK